ncbi:MAG TPA: non-ribosomal peptide synthetase [Legionella sp.]|nr:non-ribosomal peptide synthetase [Legionella sp.]
MATNKIDDVSKNFNSETNIQPIVIPHLPQNLKSQTSQARLISSFTLSLELQQRLLEQFPKLSVNDFLFAVLFLYLYRMSRQEPFIIDISSTNTDNQDVMYSPWSFHFQPNDFSHFLLQLFRKFNKRTKNVNLHIEAGQQNVVICLIEKSLPKKEYISNHAVTFVIDCNGLYILVANSLLTAELHHFMKHIPGHIQMLVQGIIGDKSKLITHFPLLTPKEYRKIVIDWNQTARSYPESTLTRLYELRVESIPAQTAVVCGSDSLSYGALNERANQLAHYLITRGVGAEVSVGVCLERSIEMVVCLLGILKAGGIYLPLDASYPVGRLKHIIADAKADICLTQEGLLASLDEVFCTCSEVLLLDDARIRTQPVSNLATIGSGLDHTAYLIYTSGSTGLPKEVRVPQRTLVNLIHWAQGYHELPAGGKTTQLASIGFDVSLEEMMYALLSGYELHVVAQELKYDLRLLSQYVQQQGISRLFLPTALLDAFVRECTESSLALLKLQDITVAGEALKISHHMIEFFRAHPHLRLSNEYGPSETHVVTCYQPDFTSEHPLNLIGWPIANTQTYILDEGMNPVVVGGTGELYLGGDNVALGYLNRPELSAERFRENPFIPGGRLYKTGDLCRYLSDGSIEYLGRIDQQVKIRGFRIEPGEIEHALLTYGPIKQVSVQALDAPSGGKQLVAYCVSAEDLNQRALKAFLATCLPDYMIPSVFVTLEKLPLNANGKLDRDALPVPENNRKHAELVLPHNPLELALMRIWSSILKIETLGITDNFFELGGHSLLAVELVTLLRRDLNIVVPVAMVFTYPTIEALASALQKQ